MASDAIKRNGLGSNHERHGLSELPEYYVWSSMKKRCDDQYTWNYRRYGGRGISYTKRWMYFSNFIGDMGNRPSPKHQLDRIDVNGNYCKENCRWVTPQTNAANRPRYSNCMGAYKRGSKYTSIIGVNNKTYVIGTFPSKKEAQAEYVKMFKEWHGFYPIGYKELSNEI